MSVDAIFTCVDLHVLVSRSINMLSVTDFVPKGFISGVRVQAALYFDMLDVDQSPNDLKEMKTRNDCEIACDCVKLANVVLHVGLCKEIFARKHTATHKPTSAHSAHMTTMTHTHTPINRLWSPLAYGLGGNNRPWSPKAYGLAGQ